MTPMLPKTRRNPAPDELSPVSRKLKQEMGRPAPSSLLRAKRHRPGSDASASVGEAAIEAAIKANRGATVAAMEIPPEMAMTLYRKI